MKHLRTFPFLVIFCTLLYPVPHYSFQSEHCSQPAAARERLMRRAEQKKFTLRRVEFVGLTYTPDNVVRRRMVRFTQDDRVVSFNEGDFFTRRRLVQSLRSMSKLRREIYPVQLRDVSLNLNEDEETVDLLICFKAKRR